VERRRVRVRHSNCQGRSHTFDNASSENDLPVRCLETSEGTSRGASFIEFNCLVSVLEQAGS
jgi:hypothetical protein